VIFVLQLCACESRARAIQEEMTAVSVDGWKKLLAASWIGRDNAAALGMLLRSDAPAVLSRVLQAAESFVRDNTALPTTFTNDLRTLGATALTNKFCEALVDAMRRLIFDALAPQFFKHFARSKQVTQQPCSALLNEAVQQVLPPVERFLSLADSLMCDFETIDAEAYKVTPPASPALRHRSRDSTGDRAELRRFCGKECVALLRSQTDAVLRAAFGESALRQSSHFDAAVRMFFESQFAEFDRQRRQLDKNRMDEDESDDGNARLEGGVGEFARFCARLETLRLMSTSEHIVTRVLFDAVEVSIVLCACRRCCVTTAHGSVGSSGSSSAMRPSRYWRHCVSGCLSRRGGGWRWCVRAAHAW
jgi:hypothetical protein